MTTISSLAQRLATCIVDSVDEATHDFKWDEFFQYWFRELGTPYLFLFKRHLGVTNAQYVELFSLLRLYAKQQGNDEPGGHELLMHSTDQLKGTLTATINSLIDVPTANVAAQAEQFAKTYEDILASTIAVDMFYCSCAVFLPPSLDVDLKSICVDAGYIHSAGKSVFVRNIGKARQQDFYNSLTTHLSTLPEEALPIPFVVYAHEDFTRYDRDSREQIRRGIDSTKIYVEKMHMGAYRLSQIIHEMRGKYNTQLNIPAPGRYDVEHDFKSERTLWLISDRSIVTSNPVNPGRNRYYICYEQWVKNANPYFIFDENKPAWKSHTTLPHSLTAALLNCARPIPSDGVICDPFGGTGTTWFEARRLELDATVRCSDLSHAAPLLVSDNLEFFLSDSERLHKLSVDMKKVLNSVRSGREGVPEQSDPQATFQFLPEGEDLSEAGPYLYAVNLLKELRHDQPKEDQDFELSDAFVARLRNLEPITRYIFYVVLRAELRFQGGFKRGSIKFETAFCDSLEELTGQLDRLISLKESIPYNLDPEEWPHFIAVSATYSPALVPGMVSRSAEYFASVLGSEVSVADARDLPVDSFDLVISDPPYGFNTTEDQAQLANLYAEFIRASLLSLKEGGHWILCVPETSYTGRDLPYCTRAGLITSQVLTCAEQLGRRAFIPARSVPAPIFGPPYYWESEKALRRVVLHFQVSAISHRRRREGKV